jgi:ubiquinone/menaquinone biosynthesis C-methylase UbiE/uncharacterized protein YbaR (Trm112 family)
MGTDFMTGYVCPLTRAPLARVSIESARAKISGGEPLAGRVGDSDDRAPTGETPEVLLRNDERVAYPIVDDVPILLAPEVLTHPRARARFDLQANHYAEAYNEMLFYDAASGVVAEQIDSFGSLALSGEDDLRSLSRQYFLADAARTDFPNPPDQWLSARMDLGSEWDCYAHLAPVRNKHVVQLGGRGSAAMKMLLAGAARATLLTPMHAEAKFARKLARILEVSERFECFVAIAEEIPLPDESIDGAYAGGCVHHMTTALAFPEIARILKPGGRFAAVEPWRAPLYALGTWVFGKREANPYCRPLTRERVAPMFDSFPKAQYIQHGALSRYPMLAMEKLGAHFSHGRAWNVGRLDDRLCSLIPGMRRLGSGVALLATK